MNKTININLAIYSFILDEVAYSKLQANLEAINVLFAKQMVARRIISGILKLECRYCFRHEKMENERQVITEKEVTRLLASWAT